MSRQTGDYHRSCDGKAKHDSEAKAWRAIAGVTKRRGWDGKMNAYRCGYCGFWHIGHARQAKAHHSSKGNHDYRTA